MIRIGLMGFGFMGGTHYQAYQNIPGVEVVGIFDLQPDRVRRGEVAAGNIGDGGAPLDLSGVQITDQAEDLIGSADIDMVDICLPTYVHADYAVKALDAGKHVFCEKPMAMTPGDCDRMLQARDRAGKKLMIGQCVRFWPEYAYAAQVVQQRQYGGVLSAFFRRLSPTPTWSYNNWILDEKLSGGALLDLHIHDIDYVLHAFGPVHEVEACGVRNVTMPGSGVDYVCARYRVDSDALVVAEGGWHYHPGFPFNMSFNIRCEQATLLFDPSGSPALSVCLDDGTVEHPAVSASTGWDEELKYFADCVEHDRDVAMSPPEESRTAVGIALHEQRSIQENRRVSIGAQ